MVRDELREDTKKQINRLEKQKEKLEKILKNLLHDLRQLDNILSEALVKVCDENLASIAKSILEHCGYKFYKYDNNKDRISLARSPSTALSVEVRSRSCLREIDRVESEENTLVESILLHELPQLFPKDALLVELNRYLDSMEYELIRNQEESHPMFYESPVAFNEDEISVYSFESTVSFTKEVLNEREEEECKKTERNKCLACNSQDCQWKSEIDYSQLLSRRKELTHLILDIKKVKNHGDLGIMSTKEAVFRTTEVLLNATLEADQIDDEIHLYHIDKELHDAYNHAEDKYIVTRALHKYECMMDTHDAICALEREQHRLIAKLTAKEVIFDVLEWYDELYTNLYFYFRESSYAHSHDKLLIYFHQDGSRLVFSSAFFFAKRVFYYEFNGFFPKYTPAST